MFGAVAAAALCWGCGSAASSLPERVAVPFETVCPQADGTPVFIGGYGSAMGYDAADSCFWLLTDRGPNVDGPTPESKVFALPEFAPRVGKFRLSGDSLEAVGTVPLRDAAGNLFSGLPAAGGDRHLPGDVRRLLGQGRAQPRQGQDQQQRRQGLPHG